MAVTRRSFILMSMATTLAACQKDTAALQLNGSTMGTTYNVVAVDHSRSLDKAAVQSAIDSSLAQVNFQMSNWDSSSEISKFNALRSTAATQVSPELAQVLKAAADVNMASDGQFDVTLGPLIEAWGFGATGSDVTMPTDAEVAQALETVGQNRVVVNADGTIQKTNPETGIYLSAIGKGFGVDEIARTLASFGVTDYMVEIGGDIYTAGVNPEGKPWQIGIETPAAGTRSVQQVVGVSGMGMATSGDYRNYFEQDGVRYSHILDAKTGRPITHTTASVTVVTENAMMADAWATAMLVLGRERGMQIAQERDLAVLFIEREANSSDMRFKTIASDRFAALQA